MEPSKGHTPNAWKFADVSTKQRRIATMAKQRPDFGFTSLNYFIDTEWLETAYARTRKDGATGIDGQTATSYAAALEENLQSLLDRAKSGRYFAPPVRRVHIPKDRGSTRPIGIPTFEDKVLQRAVAMILEPIYEQDFLSCSYGFRPRRSAHDALDALWHHTTQVDGGWIVEVDIQAFFDNLDHARLRELLRLRVRDGVLLRLIGKWLNAGVLESGCVTHPDSGSPQGGVISPLLANVYLHYVVDVWFEQEIRPRLNGRGYLIRYADDLVMGFSSEEDARATLDDLRVRLEAYGLTLHPDKTRLIDFRKSGPGDHKPGVFEFLGLTHYWGRSRSGRPVVKRRTAARRLSRALRSLNLWCRTNRHEKPATQQRTLARKLNGHYGYYGITGNSRALNAFYLQAKRIWKKWLSRRSQKGYLDWPDFCRILDRYPLPEPKVVKSIYRQQRNLFPRSRMN